MDIGGRERHVRKVPCRPHHRCREWHRGSVYPASPPALAAASATFVRWRNHGIRYIPKNITEVGRYRSSEVAWVSLALVPRLSYPNFLRQSCPEIGEYDDLESSKNRRSASWHGNQHVRLRGAQIKSTAAPARLTKTPGARGWCRSGRVSGTAWLKPRL
jgi:hypothetical protein